MSITLDGTTGITAPAINAGNIVGEVAFFGMTTPPAGWLKANGALVSRSTYANLFAVMGTTFGAGDGSTTFNLPDLRGEFLRGWDDGRGVDSGRAFGTAQGNAIQSHQHNVSWNQQFVSGGGLSVVQFMPGGSNSGVNAASPTGGTETRPRNVALLACIKF